MRDQTFLNLIVLFPRKIRPGLPQWYIRRRKSREEKKGGGPANGKGWNALQIFFCQSGRLLYCCREICEWCAWDESFFIILGSDFPHLFCCCCCWKREWMNDQNDEAWRESVSRRFVSHFQIRGKKKACCIECSNVFTISNPDMISIPVLFWVNHQKWRRVVSRSILVRIAFLPGLSLLLLSSDLASWSS